MTGFDRLYNLPNLRKSIIASKRFTTKKFCDEQFGFTVKVSSPLWKRVRVALAGMKISDLESRPNNLSFHNLCTSLFLPVG